MASAPQESPRGFWKVIGILGGMGPEATADLFGRLVRLVPARRDQDHPRILVDSNPLIPDRTAAITGRGESPLPALVETALALERAGAQLLAIPCNSAHHWYDAIAASVRIPVLHMVRLTAAAAGQACADATPPAAVLVLATTGTLQSGLYQAALQEVGLRPLVPSGPDQEKVMEAIYLVKAGKRAQARSLALGSMVELCRTLRPAAVILGCTELPLVLGQEDCPAPLVDSTDVLARATLREAWCGPPTSSPAPIGCR